MRRSILILTNRVPYPLHDGGAMAMDAMIRGYAGEGWDVRLLAMNTSRHTVANDILARLYSDITAFETVDVDNAVSTRRILKNLLLSSEPEHAGRFRNDAFAKKLESLLRKVKPDVVQLESPFLASYIPIIRKESSAKLVYRMHNVEAQIWSRLATESGGIKRFYLRNLAKRMERYERQLWQDADLLLPITEKDAATVKEAGIDTEIVVAPFGIEHTSYTATPAQEAVPYPRDKKIKAYHIGAMDWLPNAEAIRWFLDEVWPLVQQWAPEAEFHFAGRAMPESFMTALPFGAHCVGEVGDVSAFIADKDVLVVPIRSGGGIRVKILEAMAAGKLVLSTDIGMQGIEAQPELHYLRANSAQEFAHLIAWAGAHAEKAETITYFAKQLIRERYDAKAIMKKVIAGLESIRQ